MFSKTMTNREARFLASQAERLADNKQRHQQQSRRNHHRSNNNAAVPDGANQNDYFLDDDDDAPNLSKDEIILVNVGINNHDDDDNDVNQKEEGHRFWRNFRNLCLELQSQIEILLHWEGGGAADGGGIANKYDTAKAYYSTATRRSEGRIQLDCILENVRLLRRHCLSSSSMLPTSKNNDDDDVVNPLLSTLLSTPMPEMTQTDIRILSEEMDRLLKCIDEARMIISPKEKFVFRRYRKAMEEQKRTMMNNQLERHSIMMEEYWKINATAPLKYFQMGTSR